MPTGMNGVILASHGDRWFVVTTIWGKQLFEAQTFCFDVAKDDPVVFNQSTGACASNAFVDSRNAGTCDVWCSSTPDSGKVVAIADRVVTVTVRSQNKAFELGFGCSPTTTHVGDELIFTRSSLSCSSNTVLNTRTGTGCDVRCL